jgi:PDZ domain-containing protein
VRHLTPARLLVAGLVILAAAFALWILPSKQYIFLPDRAHAVAPLVKIPGGHDPRDGGGIYFVDVIVRKATLLERLFGGLHEGADLYKPQQVIPDGLNDRQQRQVDLAEMHRSQRIAAAVALQALGRKVRAVPNGALVSGVQHGLPAVGKLEPSDVIIAVDGVPVRSPEDVSRAMRHKLVGAPVRFTVRRGGEQKVIAITTVASRPGSRRPIVGVFLEQATDIRLPLNVSIDANGVGGPSAGLAFALDVMEELGRNVDRGHKVAATGEIFLNGAVGPIGGVKQKTIGARRAGVDAFLVPAGDNAREARKYAHGLRIIPVKSFQQALHALATLPAAQ